MTHAFRILVALLVLNAQLYAEGTRQLAPNGSISINGNATTDIAALHINADEYNNFASYTNSDPTSRLYINIQDPTSECIYLGFSAGHPNSSTPNPTFLNFEYRIVDPNGNIVFGPVAVTPATANIVNWQEAFNGPSAIAGPNGYASTQVQSSDLTSQGNLSAGNYYIEFLNTSDTRSFLIDFWDITVAQCAATPLEKPGRVWSYNWALFAINDYGFPERPFNGAFYVCAPDPGAPSYAFISKIDFNGSGFRPAAFNIAFNDFGASNTGDINFDRKSVENQNSAIAQYEIFLQDPVDLCQTAQPGEIEIIGVSRCSGSDYCIKLLTSKEGQIELLLDFDGNDNIYTPGTSDVIITQNISASEVNVPICVDWDGLDGLGNPLSETVSTTIPITISFAQGIYHFPIYDAEYLTDGFNVTAVRPAGPTPSLYYDDSNISTNSGSGEPNVQLNGCPMPCHRWTNYTAGDIVGFGNLNTINSWWFSQQVFEQAVVNLPASLTCSITGPDTLCLPGSDTLNISVAALPAGAGSPTVVSYTWNGPGVIGSTNLEYAVVNQEGTYSCRVAWLTSLNDTCYSECSIILIGAECCEPSLTCDPTQAPVPCDSVLPSPATTIAELVDMNLISIQDEECANYQVNPTVSVTQSGCEGDPRITIYNYEIWNDINSNGMIDNGESSTTCSQQFTSVDTSAPVVEFIGDMAGYQSGDTMYIPCQTNDPNWEIPMPTVDDISAVDACGNFTIELADIVEESSDCAADGYISIFTCKWIVTDDCDNVNELIIYMVLIDETPPEITYTAPDITLSCTDEMPMPASEATDECNCAHLSVDIDTVYFNCSSDYQLKRIYSWEDHCGNIATSSQFVTISNSTAITLDIPEELANDLEVECAFSTIPMWVAELNANSISASSPCGSLTINHALNQIEGTDCAAGYTSKWESTWTVADDCGTALQHQIMITVVDNTPPTVAAFPPFACSDEFDPYAINVDDNCGVERIEYDNLPLTESCNGLPQIKHTWTIYDYCGNHTYAELITTTGDTSAPIIIKQHGYQSLNSGDKIYVPCDAEIIADNISSIISFVDKCEEISVDFSLELIDDLNCSAGHQGQYLATWQAEDACGNQSNFELFVERELVDLNSILPNDIQYGSCGNVAEIDFDNTCLASAELIEDALAISCQGSASYQIYRLTDNCGNVLLDTIHYFLSDDEAPVFNDLPDVLCGTDESPTPLAWDACEERYVNVYPIYSTVEECGIYMQMVTYIAADDCDNEARHEMLLVPEIPEITIDLFYDDEKIIDGNSTNNRYEITMDCAEDLDLSLFTIEPACEFLTSFIAKKMERAACTPGDTDHHVEYEISVNIGNCAIKYFYVDVFLTDDVAPFFINPPADITLSCIDSLPTFDIEVFDHCSEVSVTETITSESIDDYEVYTIEYTATDQCLNTRTHTHQATVFEAPECTIQVPAEIYCYEIATLTSAVVGGIAPYTYEWKVEQMNCELIAHDSGDGSSIDVRLFSGSATVTLIVTDSYGCSSMCTTEITCLPKPSTLTQDANALTAFAAYPNPTSAQVQVVSEQPMTQIQVTDLLGRTEYIDVDLKHRAEVELSTFSSGVLILRATMENGSIQSRRVIKL